MFAASTCFQSELTFASGLNALRTNVTHSGTKSSCSWEWQANAIRLNVLHGRSGSSHEHCIQAAMGIVERSEATLEMTLSPNTAITALPVQLSNVTFTL